jgi:RNA ligase (TIGR02306 family)
MSDWQPQVVRIEKVVHHSDADSLDIATVLGDYPVIIKRDEYKEGMKAGYIPIDSIVPDTDQFYFLCPKQYEKYEENGETKSKMIGPKFPMGSVPEKYRIIKAKKIRGVYSQGMLVPIPQTTGGKPDVGTSIVDFLGLKKWDEPEEENLPGLKHTRGTNAEKAPSGWAIPHYDIDGIRKYIDCLQPGEKVVLTEKLHGSNAAFCHDGERLWVKSRNFYKKMDPDDMWWDIAIRYDLEKKLSFFPKHVFFGEVYGQVKGFRYDTLIENGVLLTKIRFFDVWDLAKMRYLDYNDRIKMIARADLDAVPQLYFGEWKGKEEMYPFAEGPSTLNPKHIREGWVLNTVVERYEPRLDSRMHVKLVGEAYNLQK